MVRVSADSVWLMPRTAAVTLPYSTALASANSAPMVKLSAPGDTTSSTPQKPTTSARPRARPIGSRSQNAANNVANKGAEKLIAMAPAIGIRLSAIRMQLCATCLRDAAADMLADVLRAEHGQAGARHDQQRADDQRHHRAEQQHFGERIGVDLPFRQSGRAGEHHGRAQHEQDAERHLVGARRRSRTFEAVGHRGGSLGRGAGRSG